MLVEVKEGGKWVGFTGYEGFKVRLRMEFEDPVLKGRWGSFEIDLGGKW